MYCPTASRPRSRSTACCAPARRSRPLNPTMKHDRLALQSRRHRAPGAAVCDPQRAATVRAAAGDAGSRSSPTSELSARTGRATRAARDRPRCGHLHVRLDRRAQGRDAHTPQHDLRRGLDRRVPRADRDDRVLCVLQLSFDYGLYQLLTACGWARRSCSSGLRVPRPHRQAARGRADHGPAGRPHDLQVLLSLRGLAERELPRPALPHERRRRAPGGDGRRVRATFPGADLLPDVRPDRVQARLLPAAGAARTSPESSGIPIPGTEAWVEDEAGRGRAGPARSAS